MLNYEYHVVLSSMVIHIMVIIIITHHPKCKPQGKETATAVCSASGWKLPADDACSAATQNTKQIVYSYSIFIIFYIYYKPRPNGPRDTRALPLSDADYRR